MIDMHLHAVNPQLPGSGPLPALFEGQAEDVAAALQREMQESGTEVLLGMGRLNGAEDDPLGIASTLSVARSLPALYAIGVADPTKTNTAHLQAVERQLQSGKVKVLKAYLGYIHQGPDSPGYVPYYELAARYAIPFVFHTGDTYSDAAKVKYAHPLLVDEVAVDHRGVEFVMAHFGNPWIVDAAEVLYKNENVWADLSGLLIGDEDYFALVVRCGALRRTAERIRQGIEYADRPDKFLYGTDWPLAPMRPYRDFVRLLFPETQHEMVFRDNAKALFKMEKT